MILTALLLAQLTIVVPESGVLHDGFDAAKVGEAYTVESRCDCNVCTFDYVKISETERQATGGGRMTLMSCGNFPIEKVR